MLGIWRKVETFHLRKLFNIRWKSRNDKQYKMDPTPCEETQIQGYPDGCQDPTSKRYSKEKKVKNKSKRKIECEYYQAVNFQKRNKVEAEPMPGQCSIDQVSVSEIRVYLEDRPDHWRYFELRNKL